jgi:hypothetical protein
MGLLSNSAQEVRRPGPLGARGNKGPTAVDRTRPTEPGRAKTGSANHLSGFPILGTIKLLRQRGLQQRGLRRRSVPRLSETNASDLRITPAESQQA